MNSARGSLYWVTWVLRCYEIAWENHGKREISDLTAMTSLWAMLLSKCLGFGTRFGNIGKIRRGGGRSDNVFSLK